MKKVVFLIMLALIVPGTALAGLNETFESYSDSAAWVTANYGGAELTGEADFEVVGNVLKDAVNSSDKVLHITSPVGTASGYLKYSFAPMSSGSFAFDVYTPCSEGSLNYAAWVVGGVNPTLFHGVMYEYLNRMYYQYGSEEPYGGFAQDEVGYLAAGWHQVTGTWTADGRLNMWYDGVLKASNVPMRTDIATGLTYVTFYTPDGSGTSFYGSDVYLDNVSFTAVPEPSALFALGSGLVGLLGFASRRRK